MATPRAFARRIRTIARQVETGANDLVVRTAQAVDQVVVLATPVDTGRARAGWQVGLGSPITSDSGGKDTDGGATIARNNAKIASRRSGVDVIISNNVEYIGDLNAGTSAQAPENFVEMAAQQGATFVRGARILR